MRKPKISVIIPVYNAETTIIKCLKALKKQTLKPVEIIVIDDGSTDNSKLKIKKARLQLKIKNLIFLEQKHQGTAKAKNLGVQKARGEIVVFTDSDCVPPKDWLEKITLAFSDSSVGAAGGGYSSGADNTFWQRFLNQELFFRRQKRKGLVETLVSNNMACRKNHFLQAGGFPAQYLVGEDMFLAYQISRQSKVVWLRDNGVQHHFKNSLKEFLKYQYFFGKESTRLFLDNPKLFFCHNHHGKALHFAIITSFLLCVSLLMAAVFLTLGNLFVSKVLLGVFVFLFLVHLLLYSRFIFHLKKKGFSGFEIIKAYLSSLLRDWLVSFSFFDGLALFLSKRKVYNLI